MAPRKKGGKSPPFFSHEFVITNHGDIVSCICMAVMVGLMFQATQSISQLFIAAQHNVTRTDEETNKTLVTYTCGWKDIFALFFYSLAWIVVQAIIQEYLLDKVNRRFHMSKTKFSKFNDSGNLIPFFLFSIGFGIDQLLKESLLPNISEIWEGYPHTEMSFLLKFYFILQIAYWIHMYPELYFMRTKKEELGAKIEMYTMYLVFIAAAYFTNFTRVTLLLLVIHYIPEFVFHTSRLFHCAGKTDISGTGFAIWSVLFILARCATICLTIITFWFGLRKIDAQGIDIATGTFNSQTVRLAVLTVIIVFQAWMAWQFIVYQVKRLRQRSQQAAEASRRFKPGAKKQKKDKKTKDDEKEEKPNGTEKGIKQE